MGALAGFNARVKVGLLGSSPGAGTNMFASRWQLTWKSDALDVTTFEALAGGANTPVSQWLGGITDLDMSFDVLWDTTMAPFTTSPPNVTPATFVVVQLYLNKTVLASSWFFKNVLILDMVNDAEVRGVIKYSITGRQSGGPDSTFAPSA